MMVKVKKWIICTWRLDLYEITTRHRGLYQSDSFSHWLLEIGNLGLLSNVLPCNLPQMTHVKGLLIDGRHYDWRVLLATEAERFVNHNPGWRILDKEQYKQKYNQTGIRRSAKTIVIK